MECSENGQNLALGTAANPQGAQEARTGEKRLRSREACRCCRTQKIKCNISEIGSPCSNCKRRGTECISLSGNKKLKWAKDYNQQHPTTTTSGALPSPERGDLGSESPESPNAQDIPQFLDSHEPHSIYKTLQTHPEPVHHTGMVPSSMMKGIDSVNVHSFSQIVPTVMLPSFIKPLPPSIEPDDAEYLLKKGALTVPHQALLADLLRCYVEFVHPYNPLIDLHDFLLRMENPHENGGPISLIIFQAVMYAGSAYANVDLLTSAGYSSRREARTAMFLNCKLLYDFNYDSDRVVLVQVLLLMAEHYETADDQKDTWYWMNLAVSVGRTIGLYRNPEKSQLTARSIKMWRRLWWATYVVDRQVTIGMRRPSSIRDDEFDMPLLTLEDFDFSPLPESTFYSPSSFSVMDDAQKRKNLAVVYMERIKLCLCISKVISKHYCVPHYSLGQNWARTSMMLVPKPAHLTASDVPECDSDLRNWLDNLPEEARYSDEPSDNLVLDLNRSVLHMLFYTIQSTLHRNYTSPSDASRSSAEAAKRRELSNLSYRRVKEAATTITNIAQKLKTWDLVRYLPVCGVSVLLPAIITHLISLKKSDLASRRQESQKVISCMRILKDLGDIYAAADYATAFLEASRRKLKLEILQPPTSSERNIQTKTSMAGSKFKTGVDGTGQMLSTPPHIDSRSASLPNSVMLSSASANQGFSGDLFDVNILALNSPIPSATSSEEILEDAKVASILKERVGVFEKLDWESLINIENGMFGTGWGQ